ncbi:MAG: hypothetical protein ABIP97_13615 [Chthoniobacterales bacterium]
MSRRQRKKFNLHTGGYTTNSHPVMDVSKLNTKTLNELIRLTKRKDALHNQIAKIEDKLETLFAGKAPRSQKSTRPVKQLTKRRSSGGKRTRRGALKEQIFAVLKQAGKTGISVKDVADKIKIKPQNLHVWFSTTGKKFAQITKVEQGRYRLKA